MDDEQAHPHMMNDQPENLEPEDLELEGYVLQRELTRGGQAIIFSAIKKSTGRKVAVKFFPGGSFATRKEKVRMDREVRVLAALDHPNIVSVIDRGQTADGSTYFVLEYVRGKTLAEYIDDYWEQSGTPATPDDLKELLQLFVRIADAVNAAHLRGVVHRDLKPSNIVIDSYGEPHILDFGVALSAVPLMDDEGEALPSVTWTGEFLGSVQWASPEQAEGDQSRVDVRTDVYSLGIILYELLTGDFPYDVFGTLPTVLKNIMQAKPRPPSEVFIERLSEGKADDKREPPCPIDPLLDEIVLRALEKNREDRFQTAGEFAKAVSSYLSGQTVSLRRPLVRRSKIKPIAVAAGSAVLLAIIVFAGTKWYVERTGGGAGEYAAQVRSPHFRYLNVYGFRIEGKEVVFEFDPRDYDVARMPDGSLGQVGGLQSISRVAIAGPFNEWEPRDADWIMSRVTRNRFELRKPLSVFEGQAEWPFKFVVNDQVWVSAPRIADNKEIVIEDTATYNLLLVNPLEEEGTDVQALREYRERIERIWPGQGENLVMDAMGGLHLTLTHLESSARMVSLRPLRDIPLASLHLGNVRATDLTALSTMTDLRWFVCNDTTYNQLFFDAIRAVYEGRYDAARETVEDTLTPFTDVPIFKRTRRLFVTSLEGMAALERNPDQIPEMAWEYDGRRYLYVMHAMTWTEARAYAEQRGAILCAIRSDEMQAWITDEFGWPTLGRSVWLGGTDEIVRGSWGWLTGDPWVHDNWSSGYPDREDELARALAMNYDGWWVNLNGDAHQLPFIMEWNPEP